MSVGQEYWYFGALGLSIIGLMLCDYRWRLALFSDWQRSIKTIVSAMVIFSAWDLLGIHLSIFFPGNTAYYIGVFLVPGFPVEELLFLFGLNYTALLLFLGARRYARVSGA